MYDIAKSQVTRVHLKGSSFRGTIGEVVRSSGELIVLEDDRGRQRLLRVVSDHHSKSGCQSVRGYSLSIGASTTTRPLFILFKIV